LDTILSRKQAGIVLLVLLPIRNNNFELVIWVEDDLMDLHL